mmetsp:Transcript_54754/g.163730  ORF Transcript_54754/g.163730 Transcript_54754/m.163730 type:complete len:384 (+) Transcript_54754:1069-2220(+)
MTTMYVRRGRRGDDDALRQESRRECSSSRLTNIGSSGSDIIQAQSVFLQPFRRPYRIGNRRHGRTLLLKWLDVVEILRHRPLHSWTPIDHGTGNVPQIQRGGTIADRRGEIDESIEQMIGVGEIVREGYGAEEIFSIGEPIIPVLHEQFHPGGYSPMLLGIGMQTHGLVPIIMKLRKCPRPRILTPMQPGGIDIGTPHHGIDQSGVTVRQHAQSGYHGNGLLPDFGLVRAARDAGFPEVREQQPRTLGSDIAAAVSGDSALRHAEFVVPVVLVLMYNDLGRTEECPQRYFLRGVHSQSRVGYRRFGHVQPALVVIVVAIAAAPFLPTIFDGDVHPSLRKYTLGKTDLVTERFGEELILGIVSIDEFDRSTGYAPYDVFISVAG